MKRSATRFANRNCCDEWAVRRRILLHQALQGLRHPMDGMGWQYLKSVRQLLVGNKDSALRDAFEKCTRPCAGTRLPLRKFDIVRANNHGAHILPLYIGIKIAAAVRRAELPHVDEIGFMPLPCFEKT
jgi:hypothetical protein